MNGLAIWYRWTELSEWELVGEAADEREAEAMIRSMPNGRYLALPLAVGPEEYVRAQRRGGRRRVVFLTEWSDR